MDYTIHRTEPIPQLHYFRIQATRHSIYNAPTAGSSTAGIRKKEMHIQPSDSLQQLSSEMQSGYAALQKNTIRLALPGLLLIALLVASNVNRGANFAWALATALVLFAATGVTWWVNQRSFAWAALLLSVVLFATVIMVVQVGGFPAFVCLLFLPVGFATLSFGTPWGMLAGLLASLLLLLPVSPLYWVPANLRFAALLAVWGGVWLEWLTLRPLLASNNWSWEAYRHSQMLLNEARETQARLRQALEDLTTANTQLNRLNALANNLRLVAEEERHIKEQFVANVSHELRTPLNMIIGFCEMILRSPETYGRRIPGNLLADLQVVLRNSQHLSSLIDDVLDLSQIESRQMALVKERVSVSEIVEAATIAVRPLFESKGLTLDLEVQPELPLVMCDRTRIREVLLNLLSNAGRFTEEGGVAVRAWLDGAWVMFSVTDSGPGISEEDRKKLFQPFQQLDATIRRKHGGTGLGLAISKSFVELHEGKMWVESEKGQGTTFFFRLPLDPPALSKAGFARWVNPFHNYYEKSTRVPALPAPDKRPRVLVVEPGEVLQRLLKRYLPDVDLRTAADLPAAREELEQHPAQVVLINGPSACQGFESVTDFNLPFNIPAILCSIAAPAQYATSPELPEILVKPISYDALTGAVERLGKPVKTVLLVDDDQDVQKLFRRMLASAGKGYTVLRAENGLQALELLRRQSVDLVLLDLVMPEMDGFTFLKAKANDAALHDIPVILISAQDQRGHPIVSNFIAATRSGGISVGQLLDSIQALGVVLGAFPAQEQG